MEDLLQDNTLFIKRHLGPNQNEIKSMMHKLNEEELSHFIHKVIPEDLISSDELDLEAPVSEHKALEDLKSYAEKNKLFKNYIGAGYYSCKAPSVLIKNMVQNPGWYTPYTPYQPEIAQGRLESLFIFQTMIADLTGLPVAGASLLDEATAAMEAVILSKNSNKKKANTFFAATSCHPQTLAVLEARCQTLKIDLVIDDIEKIENYQDLFGSLLQYPDTHGHIDSYTKAIEHTKNQGGLVTLACDILSLTLLKSPGELGANIALGSTQRFWCSLSMGAHILLFLQQKQPTKEVFQDVLLGLQKIEMEIVPCAWLYKQENNISKEKKQLPIFVQRKFC